MNIFYAVVDDVYSYTVGTVVRFITSDVGTHTALLLSPPLEAEKHFYKEGMVVANTEAADIPETFRTIETILHDRADGGSIAHSVMYIGSARAPLFIRPTKEFDAVTFEFPYGAMAMVLEEKARFARVSVEGKEGWILRDDLIDRAAYVYPEFEIGEENVVDDPNTLRLRAAISDTFHGGESESVLQSGEYVYYKLIRKGLHIAWPEIRPRTPGTWHTILKGVPGVSIGVVPKVGSVIEYTFPDEIGHLAYVEAVFPDESIVLSEANYPDRGIYNERTLGKEEWTALNPVFIQVV